MDPRFPLFLSSSSLAVVAMVCLLLFLIRSRGSSESSGPGSSGPRTYLPLSSMLKKKTSPFNTQYIGSPERLSVSNEVLTLRYAKNAHGGSSGAKISAVPHPLPSDAVEMGYDIYFPDSFEWRKGGKLPGLCLGKNSKDCAVASNWVVGKGSVRFMWRSRDGKNAYIIGYAYLPIGGSPTAAFKRQGSGYKAITEPGDHAGHDLWTGDLPIHKGWNSVRMKIVLNTPKKADGIIEIEVNGVTKRVNDVLFRDDSTIKVVSLNFVSFYGGSGNDWNSPQHETSTSYRNFFIR